MAKVEFKFVTEDDLVFLDTLIKDENAKTAITNFGADCARAGYNKCCGHLALGAAIGVAAAVVLHIVRNTDGIKAKVVEWINGKQKTEALAEEQNNEADT